MAKPASASASGVTDLDALSTHWRLAFWSAHDAINAAEFDLPESERRQREAKLVLERESTACLLDAVAREDHVRLLHRISEPRPTKPMMGLPSGALACVFELEGVLTGSAAVHAAAWAETFDVLLLKRSERAGERFGPFAPFNPRTDYAEHIHGRPRLEGVRAFLASRGLRLPEGTADDPPSAETVHGLANCKNQALLRRLHAQGVDAYEGSRRYLEAARDVGLHCAVVSASANTETILERAGLVELIEQRVDGNTIVAGRLRGWPAPDVLLAACRRLDVRPQQTAVFETDIAGVAAGRAGGFEIVVGVDRSGNADKLRREGADLVVGDLAELLDTRLAAT